MKLRGRRTNLSSTSCATRTGMLNEIPTVATDLSGEIPTSRADPSLLLEPVYVRIHALGMHMEVGSSTVPYSPKSLAACLLCISVAVLGLTCGLGALARWLGGPIWLCIAAAALGLVISTCLSIGLVCRTYRHNHEEKT
jgi:hypothetical protein